MVTPLQIYFANLQSNAMYHTGISRAHCIRIERSDDEAQMCKVHFLEDFDDNEGWFPRPAPLIRSKIWDTLFCHPDDPKRHGIPLTCQAHPILDKGKRQRWQVY